ncbi:MAG: alpha/beta fold hydrolase [Chloroflexi bacterium]|nr:alpha/beta fold hydrolase [Chloroflexota bacterium]
MSANGRRIVPGAEPFEYGGPSDLGVLLVHGFTGTPYEMRPVGKHLAACGFGSRGILLRGHGTSPDDMMGCLYTDWLEDVEAGLAVLLEQYDQAVLVGLSMGGTLCLNVAARHADDPRIVGVVSIGAPLVLEDWRLGIIRIASKLIKWQAWGRPDIKDRSKWDCHVGYRRFRTGTVRELLALMKETRGRLHDVRQPILVLQARSDHVVPPKNASIVFNGVSSPDRRIVMLSNCYHVVTVDFAADTVNAEIERFVHRLAGGRLAPVRTASFPEVE